MCRPWQIVLGPIAHRSHATRSRPASATRVPLEIPALDPNRQPRARVLARTLGGQHPKPRQSQDPGTIPSRSHRSSLVVCTSKEDDTGWSGARGIALTTRPPSRPPTQPAVRAGGRVLSSYRCTQIDEEPLILQSDLAHELGHYFGLENREHSSCTCGNTVMGPSLGSTCNDPNPPPGNCTVDPTDSDQRTLKGATYGNNNRKICGW
jgi:hypothetical protein